MAYKPDPTRTCRICGTPLNGGQSKYCCRSHARQGCKRRCLDDLRAALPTDDEVWAERETLVYRDLCERHNEALPTIGKLMNDRGWYRASGRARQFVKAPCKKCGKSTPIQELTASRVCKACGAPAKAKQPSVVEMERRRRMPGGDRYEAWRALEPCHAGLHYGTITALLVHRGFRNKRRAAAA